MKTTLSILLHGESGVGKSWEADTAPKPRLVIDLEGRAKYTPSGPKVVWDPREAPPVYDGTWETCIVHCPDFDTLQLVYQWLRAGNHPFISVVIDSLMEAQKRCIDLVAGVNALDQQDWGTLLRKLESLVRSYRDLTLFPNNAVEVVVFIVGSRTNDKTSKVEPLLQGQLRDTVPYYMDVVGYMFMQPNAADPATGIAAPGFTRSLLVHPQPGFVAKDGTGRLPGPVIANPDLTTIHSWLAAQPVAAQPVVAAVAPQEGVPA